MSGALIYNSACELLDLERQQAQEEIAALRLSDEARFGRFMPYYLHCPLDAIEDVALGLRSETTIRFLLNRHTVVVGADEWALDGDLALWRRAKGYARELNRKGLLKAVEGRDELIYEKTERRQT